MITQESFDIFEWDSGNALKSTHKHGVTNRESEEVFSRRPLLISMDTKHSEQEERFQCLGETDGGRKLFIVFTMRARAIRIISARPMNKKEQYFYEQAKKTQTDSTI